jgi:hypothetical protein
VNVYLDTSFVIDQFVSTRPGNVGIAIGDGLLGSWLLAVELHRTVGRLQYQSRLRPAQVDSIRTDIDLLTQTADLMDVDRYVVRLASLSAVTPLKSLDAIHIASALLWRDRLGQEVTMLTLDRRLGLAARSFGLEVRP